MIDFEKVKHHTLRDSEGNEVREYTYLGADGERGLSDEEVLIFELHEKNEELERMIDDAKMSMDEKGNRIAMAKMAKKISQVIQETTQIHRTGWNNFHQYSYATESDIKSGVRNIMSENNLILMHEVEKYEEIKVSTRNGGSEFQVKLHIIFTLIDTETGFSKEFKKIGVGQDAGDKAFYKAETGALKYALTTLFLLPSGDGDPEIDGRDQENVKKDDPAKDNELAKMKATAEFVMKMEKLESRYTTVGLLQSIMGKVNVLDANGNPKDPDKLTVEEVAKMNEYLAKWKVKSIQDRKLMEKQQQQQQKEKTQERQKQAEERQKSARNINWGAK